MSSSRLRLIALLAVSQIAGWGVSFDMPGVFGRRIAADLGMSNEMAFAGLTVMMLVSGFAGPLVGRLLKRHGAARVLAAGSLAFSAGLFMLSFAQGPAGYFAAWLVIGFGGAFGLSVPCYAAVVEREGSDAKRSIGLLMIFTGLSATFAWPALSFFGDLYGWRPTLMGAALLHLLLLAPLHLFGLPAPSDGNTAGQASADREPLALSPDQSRLAFRLIAVITITFSLLTLGLAPSLLELLQQSGASAAVALQLGSLRSVLGIAARAVDTLAGRKASPLFSGKLACLLMLVAMPVLALSSGATLPLFLFIALYGFGSGISALSRALLPLGFFSASRYAQLSAQLSLPANLAMAIAPVIVTFLIDRGGPNAVLAYCAGLAVISIAAFFSLSRIEKRAGSAG